MPGTLHLRDFLAESSAYHVARTTFRPGHRVQPHTHDFAELFWIERGTGLHLVNGESRPLAHGDLVLVRPEDAHSFQARGADGLTQVNVAFERATHDFLRERYFVGGEWPWSGARTPACFRLDDVQLTRLGELSALLFAGPPTRLVLERFLLELLHELIAPRHEEALPPWLTDALRRFAADPHALAQGVPALAALAGRTREHVSRVVRARTGRTATELVNEIRLDRAAADLRLTDAPIAAIAVDCGVANLSHFYRLFRARFGLPPRRYRLRHQGLIRGSAIP